MPAPDQKPDSTSTPRPDLASGAKSDAPGSRSASPSDPGAPDAPPETKDDGATKARSKGKEDKDTKSETVECPSCAGAAEGQPAKLVPYPDDGPNIFKRGTAFCEREGKRVRVDQTPDEGASESAAESAPA